MRHSNNFEESILSTHVEEFENLTRIYERLDSQFFRIISGIQSRPDLFDLLRLVMTFLTTFEVTRILRNFRVVLGRKRGKEISRLL